MRRSETIDPPTRSGGRSSVATLQFDPQVLDQGLDTATAGLVVLDVDGDLKPDLLVWCQRGEAVSAGKNGVPSGLGSQRGGVHCGRGF
jgi:hypothetical protein